MLRPGRLCFLLQTGLWQEPGQQRSGAVQWLVHSSWIQTPVCKPWPHHFLAVQPWATCLTSLKLSFLT